MTGDDEPDLSSTIAELRKSHADIGLDSSELDPDPLRQFARWLAHALEAGLTLPNTMTLATASKDARPSARVVLLKGLDERGFVFYTNHASRKGRELAENPRAALVFYWAELERQVRVTGTVAVVARVETEEYFRTRPFGSRVGAWASRQSSVISGRAELEERLRSLMVTYSDEVVPVPPFWGGYRLAPEEIEFWQGRENRLHDRLRYRKGEGGWEIERLSP
jgi:pyridoxamine 5'-phosphate oxidase